MRLTLTTLWLPILLLLRVTVAYSGVELAREGALRDQYEARAEAIADEAERRLATDAPGEVAHWAVDARNALKAEVRDAGNPITKKLAEDRNAAVYGDPLGPSYELLAGKLREEGVSSEAVDAAIVAGASRTNAGVNGWANALQAIGVTLLAGYALAATAAVLRAERRHRVALASQEAVAFGVAVGGASTGVALLAPVELVVGTALDTVLLGVCGVALALPLVWAGWFAVAAVLACWGPRADFPASEAPPRGRSAEAERYLPWPSTSSRSATPSSAGSRRLGLPLAAHPLRLLDQR